MSASYRSVSRPRWHVGPLSSVAGPAADIAHTTSRSLRMRAPPERTPSPPYGRPTTSPRTPIPPGYRSSSPVQRIESAQVVSLAVRPGQHGPRHDSRNREHATAPAPPGSHFATLRDLPNPVASVRDAIHRQRGVLTSREHRWLSRRTDELYDAWKSLPFTGAPTIAHGDAWIDNSPRSSGEPTG